MRPQRVSAACRITYFSPDEPHAVYRAYDETGRLLYIGTSYNPAARLKVHRATTAWGKLVTRHTEEWHPNRIAAQQAELKAIRVENPDYNGTGTELGRLVSTAHLGDGGRAGKAARIATVYAARDERIAAERAAKA